MFEFVAYERRWPIGARQRVWLDVLLYSGLRRGDAVRYGRQHVHNNVGTIKVQKSGYYPTKLRVVKHDGVTEIVLDEFVYRTQS